MDEVTLERYVVQLVNRYGISVNLDLRTLKEWKKSKSSEVA